MNTLKKIEKELGKVLDLGKLKIPMKGLLWILINKKVKPKLLIIWQANGEIYEYHPNETKKPNDIMEKVRRFMALQTLAFEKRITSKPSSTQDNFHLKCLEGDFSIE